MRAAWRFLVAAGWAALAAAAVLGVGLSAGAFLAAAPFTRPLVASRLVRILDEAIAGRLELKGVEVLSRGGIQLRGLEVYDPDGHLVLSVGRAQVFVDLTGVRDRAIGITVELEAPSVLLEEEPEGGVSIARAFAPERKGRTERPSAGEGAGSPWTVHVSRLTVRRGDVWWVDAAGETRLEASDVDVDARGLWGHRRARVDLRVRGQLADPVSAPFALDLVGGLTGGAARIPVLRAELGRTAISALGEGDLARRAGRVAVTRLGIARDVARALAPRAPDGADLAASVYAESDGSVLTAALQAAPSGARDPASGAPGSMHAALAARVADPASALGFDVVLERLDPSRLAAELPAGDVTLTAHGAVAGRSIRDLRGQLAASVKRSRLRDGEITRAEVVARADRGALDLPKASFSAPGVTLEGALRWRDGGEVSGRAAADASDLGRALANLGALLGRPLGRVQGRARLDATLAGTSSAPTLSARAEAPLLRLGSVSLSGARATAQAAGPLRTLGGRVEATIAGVRSGSGDIARGVSLRGALVEDAGSVSATAILPGFRDPASLEVHGRLAARRDALLVSELAFAYPGTRWTLAAPAVVSFAGPSVDQLELRADAQRIGLSGGLGRRGALDARAQIARLDLARLPAGLARGGEALSGELSADLRASGTAARPEVSATFSLAGAAFRTVTDLAAVGSARYEGAARRASASIALSRGGVATLDVEADLPVPLAGRPAERVRVAAKGRGLSAQDLLAAAGSDLPVAGLLALDATLDGTVGAPSFRAEASLSDAAVEDLDGLAVGVSIDDPGERVRVSARTAHEGRGVLAADVELPLDLSDVLTRPAEALRAIRRAPLLGNASLTGLDLRRIAGRARVPDGLAGVVDANAALSGALAAPRGVAVVDVAGGAIAGYRDLSARAELSLGDAEVSASGRAAVGGDEALRFRASLGAPAERLAARDAFRAAPLRAEVTIPKLALARAATADRQLGGTVEGKLAAAGTPRSPEVTLALEGRGVVVEGRPLGDVHVEGRYGSARTFVDGLLRPTSGGTLRATLAVDADLGVGARGTKLRDAPAEVAFAADPVDLGFLAAVAPGTIRAVAGKLSMDLRARGPLARMSPRGALHVTGGRLAVSELGEWTDIAVDATVTDEAIEVSRVEVHRGSGKLKASGSLRGIGTERAELEAHLASDGFTVARAGMDLATVDLRADATGSYADGTLAVAVQVPRGVVRLPKKTPRALQPIAPRPDIVVGRRAERRRRAAEEQGESAAAPPMKPFTLDARVVVPRNLFVKGDDPRVDLELKADVRYELVGSADYAEGTVEVLNTGAHRGSVEPIAGRNFVVEHARVQFTGGPPRAALLDVEARYDNPAAVVTVIVQGPATKPEIRLSSQPPMEDAQIAMLIATGRTEFKAGSGAVGTLTGEEAGKAALGALATQAFKNLVANKLPLDTVALDSGAIRAGKYLTDKMWVGYTRRFDADPEKGENADEVRVEYQISPRWTFESRYGNAQSGGASLIWSRDF